MSAPSRTAGEDSGGVSRNAWRTGNLIPSQAYTTSFQSNALDATGFNKVTLFLLAGTVTGTTPTLNVAIEISDDGTNWYALNTLAQELSAAATRTQTAFAQVTASNAKEALRLGGIFPIPRFIRCNSTIGGTTPSFTFGVNYVLS